MRVTFKFVVCQGGHILPLMADKLAASLEAELKRLQKRRLFVSSDPSPCHQVGGDATAPATWVCPPSSPRPKDQPLFTLKQVVMVCQRKLKEREEHLKEEFERVLSTKLAGEGCTPRWGCGGVGLTWWCGWCQ